MINYFLEILMMGIRGKTIAFASNKKKEQEIIEKQLEEEIKKKYSYSA